MNIKPLEWKFDAKRKCYEADTPVARAYRINELAGSDCPYYETSGGGNWTLLYEGDDLPAAKAAAQADYEARILDALSSPAQGNETEAWLNDTVKAGVDRPVAHAAKPLQKQVRPQAATNPTGVCGSGDKAGASASPAQEPVAWYSLKNETVSLPDDTGEEDIKLLNMVPLYLPFSPQGQREGVDLSNDERAGAYETIRRLEDDGYRISAPGEPDEETLALARTLVISEKQDAYRNAGAASYRSKECQRAIESVCDRLLEALTSHKEGDQTKGDPNCP